MSPKNLLAALIVVVAGLTAACSSAATPVPPTPAPATPAPSVAASAPASGAPAAGGPVIKTATVGGATLVVASANGMTVYTFANDVKDSGKSACSGGCITKWPAVTVATGSTATGDTGVTGKIGTITRDDGTTQVTYNGLPLYFFSGDKAAGDANGVYTNWLSVKP